MSDTDVLFSKMKQMFPFHHIALKLSVKKQNVADLGKLALDGTPYCFLYFLLSPEVILLSNEYE